MELFTRTGRRGQEEKKVGKLQRSKPRPNLEEEEEAFVFKKAQCRYSSSSSSSSRVHPFMRSAAVAAAVAAAAAAAAAAAVTLAAWDVGTVDLLMALPLYRINLSLSHVCSRGGGGGEGSD